MPNKEDLECSQPVQCLSNIPKQAEMVPMLTLYRQYNYP